MLNREASNVASGVTDARESRVSTVIERGARLCNAFNNETFVFSGPVDDPDVARFDVILEQGGSGGGNALVHIHPSADEHFLVKSGRIKVVVDGQERILGIGEGTVVRRGTPHIALTLHTYRDHFYLAGPPIFLQKLMFSALSPLARLRGYQLEIEPAR